MVESTRVLGNGNRITRGASCWIWTIERFVGVPLLKNQNESGSAQQMRYRADIDGLRAIAVLPVVFFHVGFSGFPGGFVGVDVFFIISGFLITSIIWRELSFENFSIARFYERRARRILPALFVVILFSAICATLVFTPEELTRFAISILGSVFFVQNFVLSAEAGYFDAAAETKPLLHIWSLAVEEQFYILFPIVLLVSARWMSRSAIVILLIVLAGLSFCLSSYLMMRSPVFNFYMLPTRAWDFLAGSLLAVLGKPIKQGPSRILDALSVVGLAAILLPVVLYSPDTPFPGYTAALPVLGAVALICSGPHSLVGRFLSLRPFVWVGLISYSLYLWHWPLVTFHRIVFPGSVQLSHALILTLLSFALAVASWSFIEQPFRRKDGLLRTPRAVFGLSALVGSMLVALALSVISGNGWTWRISPHTIATLEVAGEKQDVKSRCTADKHLFTVRGEPRGFCRLGVASADAPSVLVWGDSHVRAWYPALDAAFRNAGVSAYAIAMNGCPIAFGMVRVGPDERGCMGASAAIRAELEAGAFQKVLIVASWFGVLQSKNTVYAGVRSFDDKTREYNVTRAIADTGDALRELGVRSAFLVTVPGATKAVPEATFRKGLIGYYPEIRRTKEEYQALMGPVRSTAEKHYDQVFSLESALCESGWCKVTDDGKPLYFDSNHPSLHLNKIMLPYFEKLLSQFL
ncbi:MAG: acyltransferase family protein [Anaerolineae bacterium]